MKTLLVTVSIALAGVGTAHAQMFRPSVGNGAVVGAIAGGLIGGHSGDRWAEGAVIGGVAGALIGAALNPPERVISAPPPVYQAPASYGQQIYSQPGLAATVPDAPTVPMAPTVSDAVPTTIVRAPAPVVYVESAPRVVYVPAAPAVVYVARPPVISFGYYSGPRHLVGYRPSYEHGRHRH